jgi:glycosyltransferase involved in cell wall biosynthesis
VVTTKNREERLGALLRSLRSQDMESARFEVIVVDNASSDGTAALLEREAAFGELQLRPVHTDTDRGTGASRNLGWKASRAPLVAFTDDDCELAPDWLTNLIRAAVRNPGAVLQGRTEPIPRERGALGPLSRTKEVTSLGPYFETCNIAYPRELLERLGGFDAEAFPTWGGEDTDLAWRALAEGNDAVFVDDARAYHAVNQLGLRGGIRLALGWSDAMGVLARHPGMRRHVHRRIFWKRSHEQLLAATAGTLLARRFPIALLLAAPYLRSLAARTLGRPWLMPYFAVMDAFEVFAAVRGGLRNRTFII